MPTQAEREQLPNTADQRARYVSPIALKRAVTADAWLSKYRNALQAALRRYLDRFVRQANAGVTPSVSTAQLEQDLIKVHERYAMLIAEEGFQLAGLEFEGAKAMRKKVDDLTKASQSFLMRGNMKSMDGWIKTVSGASSKAFRKKMEKLYQDAQQGRYNDGKPWSTKKIAQVMHKRGLADSKTRAMMLARTGAIWAANEGAQQRYIEVGVTEEQWVVTRDDATCPYCSSMDGKVVRIGDPFVGAGRNIRPSPGMGVKSVMRAPFAIEHPPLHPHCRCTIVPVLKTTRVRVPGEVPVRTGVTTASAETQPRKAAAIAVQRSASTDEWVAKMSPKTVQVFNRWTSGANVRDIRLLQSGAVPKDWSSARKRQAQREKKLFEDALKKAPHYRGTVYRGLGGMSEDEFEALLHTDTLQFPFASSTSRAKKVPKQLISTYGGRRALLTIQTRSGVAIDHPQLARAYSYQQEVVIRRDVRYQVVRRIQHNRNSIELFLKEI